MKMKPLLIAVSIISTALFLSGSEAVAQTNAAARPKPLLPLVNFVLQNGEPAVCEAYLNRNLQLGDSDLSVTQKGWLGRDKLNHLVLISQTEHDTIVILRYDKQIKGVGWLTSPTGEIRQTVEFDRTPHESHSVPNTAHAPEFEVEKRYLLGKVTAIPRTAK